MPREAYVIRWRSEEYRVAVWIENERTGKREGEIVEVDEEPTEGGEGPNCPGGREECVGKQEVLLARSKSSCICSACPVSGFVRL